MMLPWARAYLVPLRLVIGVGFVMHGQAKLARGPEQFAHVLDALGIPMPQAAAWLTILVELLGGACVIIGAYVKPTAAVLAAVLATAIIGVHWQYGFSSVRLIEITGSGARFGPVGYELALVYLAALAALAFGEPTPWSIDRWRQQRGPRRGRPSGMLNQPRSRRAVRSRRSRPSRARRRSRRAAIPA